MQPVLHCLLLSFCASVFWFVYVVNQDIQLSSKQIYAQPTPTRSVLTHAAKEAVIFHRHSQPQHEVYDPMSLTAILPVNESNIDHIDDLLLPFLRRSDHLREVVIVCPDFILSKARRQIRGVVVAAEEHDHPELILRSWSRTTGENAAVMHATSHVVTEWVLLLDHKGLDNRTLDALIGRHELLYGPIDASGAMLLRSNMSCSSVLDILRSSVTWLPFLVFPMALFPDNAIKSDQDVLAHVRQRLLDLLSAASQGTGNSLSHTEFGWCTATPSSLANETELLNPMQPHIGDNIAHISPPLYHAEVNDTEPARPTGSFLVILCSLQELELISPVLCKLFHKGHQLRILLSSEVVPSDTQNHSLFSGGCRLDYESTNIEAGVLPPSGMNSLAWLYTLQPSPNVILASAENTILPLLPLKSQHLLKTVVIRIPRADLPYCSWMGTLSIREWQQWNTPRIDVSVITKDRPRSLQRLLSSLTNGRFFGDTLTLRVNMEQSSDTETMQIIQNFHWEHGSMFVHHRIVHGGLLPAVVESWYPQSNDSYGLLLEDDIELSPWFYAWIKMSILRYRYGEESNSSPQLFGISLYQQKIIELRPEGRGLFDAKRLFADHGHPPTTPYLSQIPCSWGAVYFPQHWKEFHAYLTWRLSEFTIKTSQNVVPDVRSNKWSKSWKKYFIELAYLRGYVMLYPNYNDFVSLSTNHLEPGSHVRVSSKEKREQFVLPLMALSGIHGGPSIGLLDLPEGTLPDWRTLPILNLTGSLTTLELLTHIGLSRKAELIDPTCSCETSLSPYDIRDFACIDGTSH